MKPTDALLRRYSKTRTFVISIDLFTFSHIHVDLNNICSSRHKAVVYCNVFGRETQIKTETNATERVTEQIKFVTLVTHITRASFWDCRDNKIANRTARSSDRLQLNYRLSDIHPSHLAPSPRGYPLRIC